MVGPGCPEDSTLAEGALSAPESSSRDPPSSLEVEMVTASHDSCLEDGQVVNTPLPGVACMPPPATPSPKSSSFRSVTRSPSISVDSPRGRSPSTGRRPAVRPEPNLPQTTRRSRSNLPILRAKSCNFFLWFFHVVLFSIFTYVCLPSVSQRLRVTRPHQAWWSPSLVACDSIFAGLSLFARDALRQCCRVLLLVSFFWLFLCVFSGFH